MVRAAEDGGVTLMGRDRRSRMPCRDGATADRRYRPVHIAPRVVRPTAYGCGRPPPAGLVILLRATRSTASIGGWRPQSIYATAARTNPAWEGEDEADILCRFAGGQTATAHLSLSTNPPVHEALVVGRNGHFRLIEWPAGPPFENRYRLEKNGEVLLDGLQSPSLYTHQLREFADAVCERRRPVASGREILNVMRMLDAARTSVRSGQPVAL
jgi:hypothetical protein